DDGADEDGERGEDGEDERPALEDAVAPVRPADALHVDLGLPISDCGRGAVNSAIRTPPAAPPGWPRPRRRGPSARGASSSRRSPSAAPRPRGTSSRRSGAPSTSGGSG